MEMYLVGGAVRDEILGTKSKDLDYTIVLPPVEGDPFIAMKNRLLMQGFEIFVETPDFLTIRARFPKDHPNRGTTADFVLARKESDYTDGRRPDRVEPGTLMDDLKRRDFTINAIARDSNGTLIDPFNGQWDIEHRVIRAVGDPRERFTEDALRIIRALRFKVTKGFDIEHDTVMAIWGLKDTVANVSAERVREELTKMFNHDPLKTIWTLDTFDMFATIFDMGINFQPTMKQRVR